jgi:hypothetical protein
MNWLSVYMLATVYAELCVNNIGRIPTLRVGRVTEQEGREKAAENPVYISFCG